MSYRADIDGLRAVAVLAVVLFHAEVPGFGGGFVGVDVFFVISGYLICGMIHGQLQDGTFSLGDFYKRRILRIVPALAVMMLATSVVAYRIYFPVELEDYAWSLLAAALSVSNVYFASTADYFDSAAHAKPLLHTWSLGVEEQFYVVVPVLMLLVARFAPRRMRFVLAVCLLGSLALAALAAVFSPTRAFYFAPCRAWEFLLGAALALGMVRLPAPARGRDLLGLAGLLMIGGAVVFGTGESPYLVMTGLGSLGAMLVIASTPGEGARSLAGRLLAWPPLVFVGLVSYSLYLWHWPVVVFLRTGALLPTGLPGWVLPTVVILSSFILAVLSWRFVERPFRSAAPQASLRPVLASFVAATLTLGGAGLAMAKLDGVPSRFPPEIVRLASYLGYDPDAQFREGSCYVNGSRQSLDAERCLRRGDDRPNYLLVGDSLAAHLWHGLSTQLPNVNLMQATVAQCRPLLVNTFMLREDACERLREDILDRFLAETKVDRVLVAGAWKDEDIAPLLATIDTLRSRGLSVTVFGPIVEYRLPLPRLLAEGRRRGDAGLAGRLRDDAIPARDRAMKPLVLARGAQYVSLYDAICPDGVCQEMAAPGIPMQFDTCHLTAEGSIIVARRVAPSAGLRVAGR